MDVEPEAAMMPGTSSQPIELVEPSTSMDEPVPDNQNEAGIITWLSNVSIIIHL